MDSHPDNGDAAQHVKNMEAGDGRPYLSRDCERLIFTVLIYPYVTEQCEHHLRVLASFASLRWLDTL